MMEKDLRIKKIPEEKLQNGKRLNGKIRVGDFEIECYHLDNDKRVISGRGLQKILGLNKRGRTEASGNTLKNTLLSFKKFDNCPEQISFIENVFNNEVVEFKRFGAGGTASKTHGFEATFLMDICHFIQDLNLLGILPEKLQELHKQATAVERAYSKLGIIAHIDEATGYTKEKDEYDRKFAEFIRNEAKEWEKEFPEELKDIFYRIYGIKKVKSKNAPQFFGKLINKYIYYPLAESNGAILQNLRTKNPVIVSKNRKSYRKFRFFQFLSDEVGLPELRKHLWKLIGIGNASVNKDQFNRNFARAFPKKNKQLEFEFKELED